MITNAPFLPLIARIEVAIDAHPTITRFARIKRLETRLATLMAVRQS